MSEARVNPPGAWQPVVDHWGPFASRSVPDDSVIIADARVLRLHKKMLRSLSGHRLISMTAGETAKSLTTLSQLAAKTLTVSRQVTLIALGGGTIGDLTTVFAHLLKRGVRLIQVPSTLLAAVDSSVGGKGAVNVGEVKNALGVFHYPDESWLCPQLFTTLTEAQRREGRLEAYKMALGEAKLWASWSSRQPDDETLIAESRALKAKICARDPYERTGQRTALNFGHTFGHVIEAVTHHRVRHGEAVGLGMLCALDVGVALGVTPLHLAQEVEGALPNAPGARRRLARVLHRVSATRVSQLLAADKKGSAQGSVRMVLLAKPGRWALEPVSPKVWSRLFGTWSTR